MSARWWLIKGWRSHCSSRSAILKACLRAPETARFSRARHKFDLMCELGTDLMLICSSVHPAGLGGIDRCADDFQELGEIAKSYGVRVGYEALAWGRFIK